MANRMKRPSGPPQRPARAGGLSQGSRARGRGSQGRPAITSARAPSRLRSGRLWATALVLAVALGAGVLFRGRVAPPPNPASEEPRTVVQPTTAAVSEAIPEPPSVADPETSSAQVAATEPTGAPAEPVAEPVSPAAEPASSAGQAVAEPTGAPAVPVAQRTSPSAETASSTGEPAAQPVSPPAAAEPVAQSSTPPAEPGPEPTVVAEVQLPTGAQPSTRPAQTRAPAPAPPPAMRRAATRTYTVRPHDTLKQIAARYGVSIASILAINNIPNPDSLVVGQVLAIPPAR